MIAMLKNWKGAIEINGVHYDSINDAFKGSNLTDGMQISIKLLPAVKSANKAANIEKYGNTVKSVKHNLQEYRITVKKYMTQKAEPGFDFMAKWNNDNPMPFRIMTGTVEKETRGMVYMKLHGDMYAEQMCTCMKCGKRLTNKVSQYFGIGPECGGHNYVNPFDTEEELKQAVSQYRKKLQAITWEGWIIKSAITEQEEV